MERPSVPTVDGVGTSVSHNPGPRASEQATARSLTCDDCCSGHFLEVEQTLAVLIAWECNFVAMQAGSHPGRCVH